MQKLALTVLAGLCSTLLYAAPFIEKKEEQLDRKGTAVLVTRHTVNHWQWKDQLPHRYPSQ